VRAAPDGYTLLLFSPSAAINATLYDKLNFVFVRDVAPVASLIRSPLAITSNPSFPVKTVPELMAYAKANPGKINMASAGVGSDTHLAGELFKMMTGVNMLHVPYRGSGPALTDLLAGQVQVMFDNMISSIEYVRTGKLRALAVTTATRSAALPDIPTLGEFVPGYEASGWQGVGGPKNTPAQIAFQPMTQSGHRASKRSPIGIHGISMRPDRPLSHRSGCRTATPSQDTLDRTAAGS
jgi:tripartite-type tricarboxylate transporter receptor subunit TctC